VREKEKQKRAANNESAPHERRQANAAEAKNNHNNRKDGGDRRNVFGLSLSNDNALTVIIATRTIIVVRESLCDMFRNESASSGCIGLLR
jgi:hypothetical protein